MELWLDTIERHTIERAHKLGLLHGVTTNPQLLSEAEEPAEAVLEELMELFTGPLAVQVTLPTAAEMVEQGRDLYEFSPRILVKIPVTEQGLEAIYHLTQAGIPVMATTIFTPIQAFLAAKAGAHYVAPYFSHLGDEAHAICTTIHNMNLSAKLLIASIPSIEPFVACAASDFEAITIKASLFHECLQTPAQTLKHLKRFDTAWKSAPPSKLLAPPQFIR